MSGIDRLDCTTCREVWKENGGNPPCGTCKPTQGLLPENRDAFEVYSLCEGQYVMGFGGAVSVNILSVIEVMKLKNIHNMESCLEKVKAAVDQVIAARREKK